jgi:predicted membrane protein
MSNSLSSRFGLFFIILGIGSLTIFFAHFYAKHFLLDYLFLGILLITIGITMRAKNAPPVESKRFETIRKLRQKQSEKAKKKS